MLVATSQNATPSGDVASDQSLPSDRELLKQFLSGREAAFSELVQRHAALVFGVCQRVLRHAQDAEDAFQATFLVLAKRAKSLESHDSIAGWLHQTARRTSLKLRGLSVRRRSVEDRAAREAGQEISTPAINPVAAAGIRELAEILDGELAELPGRFREVILLSQIEGLSRDEISARLGISTASVKDRLERGREQLRIRLTRRGITLSATALAAWLVSGSAQAGSLTALTTSTAQVAIPFATGTLTAGTVPAAATLAEGMIKMMAYEKLRYFAACVISFVTAGGIVFGMLRDEPTRFERGLRGQVVAVYPGTPSTITVSLDEFGTFLNLDVSQGTKVWTAFEAGQLADLKEGQYVSLRLGEDHRTVNEIHVQGTIREASIKSIAPSGKITIAEAADDDDENEREKLAVVELAPDAILRIGGLPATRNDLKPGMQVPLEFGRNGKLVHAIEAEADEKSLISGELLEVHASDNRIVIACESEMENADESEPEKKVFIITSETLLSLDDHSATFADLPQGSWIQLRVADDGKSVRAIKAKSPEPEETDDSEESNDEDKPGDED